VKEKHAGEDCPQCVIWLQEGTLPDAANLADLRIR
jgi:hypothetical protein